MPRRDPSPTDSIWFRACAGLVIFGVVFLAYVPALRAGFIWDDDAHVTQPALRSLRGLWRIWFERGATQQYYPLLHSLFWIEHRLWGDHATGYHIMNAALHATAAFLAGLTLRRLAVPGAWFAALIFALHPVHVESVAWISEQKNTLSAVLYFSAALVYLRFDTQRKPALYVGALVFFVLGLLAKTVVATLPAALLVIFWWQRGTLSWRRDILPLVPWFFLGAAAGFATAYFEYHDIGAHGESFELSALQRCLLAGRAIFFYPGKLAWPDELTFFYPRWTIDASSPLHWLPLVAAIAVTLALWRLRHRSRAPLAAWLFFAGTLFPVLGFFNVYPFIYSFVADHFQYLASLGVIAFVCALVAKAGAIASPAVRRLGFAGATIIIVALATLTWRQSRDYRDAETLYRATISRNPGSFIAWNNLGRELMIDRKRLAEAATCLERALELKPHYHEAHNNLGLLLTQMGRPVAAIPHLEEAVRLKPESFRAHNNLGIALATSGRAHDAVAAFAKAAMLNPRLSNIQENWAKALLMLGRDNDAAAHFAEAERLRALPLDSIP